MFLTRDELIDLTGRKRNTSQIEWLRVNGFTIKIAADGSPKLLRSHFENVMGLQSKTKKQSLGPDLDALRGVMYGAKKAKQTEQGAAH